MGLIAKSFIFLLLVGLLSAGNWQHGDIKEADLDSTESKSSYSDFRSQFKSGRFKYPADSDESFEDDEDDDSYIFDSHYERDPPSTYNSRKNKKENQLSQFDPKHKSVSFSGFRIDDDSDEPQPHYYNKKQLKKEQLFKPVSSEFQSDLEISKIPISDHKIVDLDVSQFKPNFELQNVPNLYPREQKYGYTASDGQIEKFLEDQQKIIDEAIEYQLLNDPNPSAKGRYHQFLKAKDDERIEKEYEENLKKKPQIPRTFKSFQNKLPPNRETQKPIKKPLGLGHYRTPELSGTYSFDLNL